MGATNCCNCSGLKVAECARPGFGGGPWSGGASCVSWSSCDGACCGGSYCCRSCGRSCGGGPGSCCGSCLGLACNEATPTTSTSTLQAALLRIFPNSSNLTMDLQRVNRIDTLALVRIFTHLDAS